MTHTLNSASQNLHLPSADEAGATRETTSSLAALHDDADAPPAGKSTRNKRLWVLALGTAALWQLDPAFGDINDMAEMIALIACTSNKGSAREAISTMRSKADDLRARIAPMPASALTKVVRRAEAACGAVLDKGNRVKEVQTSWEHFIACVRALQEPARR